MWPVILRSFTPRVVNGIFSFSVVRPNVALKNFCLTSTKNDSFKNGNVLEGAASDAHASSDENEPGSADTLNLGNDISGKYKAFRDEDSEVIFDVEEERRKSASIANAAIVDEFAGIGLKRGVTGVFDISDLVDILERQKAQDIFVVSVPPEYCYVSMMVVVTGRSTRHLQAITEFIRKVYKRRKGSRDPFLKIEGEDSKNWKALDLGNIALHVFLKGTRELYDLESLWSVGAEYDNLCRKPDDPLIALLQSPFGLEGLEPATPSQT